MRAEVVEHLLVALLAEGHVLIEDSPGVGKTTLARALARSLDSEFARVQCTADLLPADVVGTNVFNQRERRFEFRPGPIFANVVLVDEINRASPKTQSGPARVHAGAARHRRRHTHELARPFLVLATQNPVEFEGTYPLPEAQVDRFMVRALARLSRRRTPRPTCSPATRPATASLDLEPVADAAEVLAAQDAARRVHALRGAARTTSSRCCAARARTPRVELGASPRAGLLLLRAAKARALLDGRDHALPDDVQALAERGARAPHRARRPRRRRRSARDRAPTRCAATPAL